MKKEYNSGIYEGDINGNGERHGRGTFVWSNSGNRYEGEWRNDEISGQGTIYYSDGEKYVGGFSLFTLHFSLILPLSGSFEPALPK